jgi:hemerythrin-like domain-containing protein
MDMDAIRLLEGQHREVEKLFEQFENASDKAKKTKLQLCQKISDALAIHATIEEKIFYPATKDARTEELLHEAVEEHLSAKRILADLIELEEIDDQAEAKMSVLKEQIEHHVQEEEKDLFPQVRKLLDTERLEELGDEMQAMAEELREEGEPRMQIPNETGDAAPI